jgi:hypothetical protein
VARLCTEVLPHKGIELGTFSTLGHTLNCSSEGIVDRQAVPGYGGRRPLAKRTNIRLFRHPHNRTCPTLDSTGWTYEVHDWSIS